MADAYQDQYGGGEAGGEGGRIFVGSLAFATTNDGLARAFSRLPGFMKAQVMVDRETQRSRGFGFVDFKDTEAARAAIEQMNGQELDGRTITVNWADNKDGANKQPRQDFRAGGGGFGQRDAGFRGAPGGFARGGPAAGGKRGFRVFVTGLPRNATWKDLKDFLRQAGSGSINYADVKPDGTGVGEFATEQDRATAIAMLNGRELKGQRVGLREMTDNGAPASGGGYGGGMFHGHAGGAVAGRYPAPQAGGAYRQDDPYGGGYGGRFAAQAAGMGGGYAADRFAAAGMRGAGFDRMDMAPRAREDDRWMEGGYGGGRAAAGMGGGAYRSEYRDPAPARDYGDAGGYADRMPRSDRYYDRGMGYERDEGFAARAAPATYAEDDYYGGDVRRASARSPVDVPPRAAAAAAGYGGSSAAGGMGYADRGGRGDAMYARGSAYEGELRGRRGDFDDDDGFSGGVRAAGMGGPDRQRRYTQPTRSAPYPDRY